MGLAAVGAYLQALRERRGMSLGRVAAELGITESHLAGIERGERDARASVLLWAVVVVQGDAEQVQRLMVDPQATAEHGRELALG